MPSPTPLQTTGGSPLVIALTLVGLLVTAILSLAVAYLVVRGYRRNRDPARLYLAVGLVLLATGPIVFQFVLTNFTGLSPGVRSAVANASKLFGLGAMLYAIYGITGPDDRQRPKRDGEPAHDSGPERDPDRSDEVDS